MANLPLNTLYSGQGADQTKPPQGIANYAGLMATMKNLPAPTSMYERPSNGTPNFTQIPQQGLAPVGTQAVPPLDPSRYTPIPSWYSGFQPGKDVHGGTGNGGYTISDPTQGSTFIENFGSGVPGQMVIDKSNPGNLVHSNRAYTPEEDFQMLGGRSSKLYQVDHIVPLWLGGADTPANKQVLTINQHELKTASQAVALTLMANGKITTTQARAMALNWENLDNANLPIVDNNGLFKSQYDSNGRVVKTGLQMAEEVAARWKNELSDNYSGVGGGIRAIQKAGGGSFWKGLFGSVPEGTQTVVHGLGNTGKGYLPAPVQDVVGGLLEGGASGLTGGWVSAPDDSASMTKKVSSLVGNIGGMLIPVGLISRGLGWSARGVKGLTTLSKMSAARAGFTTARVAVGDAEEAALALGPAEKYALDAAKIANDPGSKGYISKLKDTAFSWDTYKNVPGFVGYGQLGPRGLAGKVTGQQDAHPTEQFFNDLSFGVASGVIPPGIKGVASMAVLPIITGAMFDREHPENWLVNAGVMATLHGMGNYGPAAKVGQRLFDTPISDTFSKQPNVVPQAQATAARVAAFHEEYTNNVSRFMMDNVLKPYVGDSVPGVGKNENLPVFHSGDPVVDKQMGAQVNKWTQDALSNLFKAAGGKPSEAGMSQNDIRNMDYADWQAEAKKIVSAGRHLYKQTLDPEARALEDARDVMSIAEAVKKAPQRPPGSLDTHTATLAAKDALETSFLKAAPLGNSAAVDPSLPQGIFPTTGMADNVSPDYNQIIDYFTKLSKGKASRKGILTLRDDTAPFWRNLNNSITAEDIASRAKSIFSDKEAENAVQHHGISWDQDGTKLLHNFGFASRESRIEGRLNSWNEHPAVKKYMATGGAEGLQPFDTKNNNVTIGEIMRKNGWKVAVSHILDGAGPRATMKATPETTIAREPFIPFKVDWAATKDLNEKLKGTPIQKKETMSELISESKNGVTAAQQSAAISEIRDRVQAPADEVLHTAEKDISAPQLDKHVATDFLRQAREVLSADTPEEMSANLADKFGVVLDDVASAQLFSSRADLTVKDLFDTFKKAEESGYIDGGTNVAIEHFFKPLFEGKGFNKWSMSKVFPNLRVLGGVKRRAAVQSQATPVTPDMTPIAPEAMPVMDEAPAPITKIPVNPSVQVTPLSEAIVKDALRPEVAPTVAPQRVSLTTQPTRMFTGDGLNVKLPDGLAKVGEDIGFGPGAGANGQTTANDWMRIKSSEPTTLAPAGSPVAPSGPVNAVKDAAEEMLQRALQLMQDIDPAYYMKEGQERGGARAYAQALLGVVQKIQPSRYANIDPKTTRNIQTAISRRLVHGEAVRLVKNAFDTHTNDYGETVPTSYEEIQKMFEGLTGQSSNAKTPEQVQADIRDTVSRLNKSGASPEEINAVVDQMSQPQQTPRLSPEEAKRYINSNQGKDFFDVNSPGSQKAARAQSVSDLPMYSFFDKQMGGTGASEGDVLRIRRNKSADDLFQMIEVGKNADPESYAHAFAYGMDKGLEAIFKTSNYAAPVDERTFWGSPRNAIGASIGTEARVARDMERMYQLGVTSKEMRPESHSKERLFAMGRGDRKGMKAAEEARNLQNAQDQLDEERRFSTGGAVDNPGSQTVQPMTDTGAGVPDISALRTRSQAQMEQVDLTEADSALFPGLTSMVAGRVDPALKPGHPNYGETMDLQQAGPDAARRGIEDARNILQYIIGKYNESIQGKGKQFLKITGKNAVQGKWTGSNEQKKASRESTNTHFENLYNEYLKSVGAGVNTRFQGVKKAVTDSKTD